MTTAKKPDCRVLVLLARDSPIGIIFRRGPTKWTQLIKWNTKTDKFEPGQWFHGRVYVGRSDLSPDGSLLIYFAAKFKKNSNNSSYSWTAISKPPYLTALARWPKDDCWHGGGLFIKANHVFLNHKPDSAESDPDHRPKKLHITLNPNAAGEDDPIKIPRMERDGWKFTQWLDFDYDKRRTKHPVIFEKVNKKSKLLLRVESYIDNSHERWLCYLVDRRGRQFEIGVGTWIDFDQQGRIVFASGGKIFAVSFVKQQVSLTELVNFNNSNPEPVIAPRWATKW